MFYVYQRRGDGIPSLVSCHEYLPVAKAAASALIALWGESGVNPPDIFICFNGYVSEELWRNGEDVPAKH